MQPDPDGEDFPLTVRVESRTPEGGWFTNLHDLTATVRHETTTEGLRVVVVARLLSAELADPKAGPCRFEITYTLSRDQFVIVARPLDKMDGAWSLVVPVIAKSDERARQTSPTRWEIAKAAGRLEVSGASTMERIPGRRERVFNLVPGFEALPLRLPSAAGKAVECSLRFVA